MLRFFKCCRLRLFALSSELFDTFFIVIHKKPLIFLHWYHHISVLLYCWQAYVSKAPVGIIFCVMNYAVHAFMYFYYFLMAIHKKPKFINAVYITVAQISQMVVGVAVTLASIYLLWFDKDVIALRGSDHPCRLHTVNIVSALIMYGSYLALFLEFFLKRYFTKSNAKKQQMLTKEIAYAKANGHYYKEPLKNGAAKQLSMKED
jgi:elongation of very long chain fatty acids protein 6